MKYVVQTKKIRIKQGTSFILWCKKKWLRLSRSLFESTDRVVIIKIPAILNLSVYSYCYLFGLSSNDPYILLNHLTVDEAERKKRHSIKGLNKVMILTGGMHFKQLHAEISFKKFRLLYLKFPN